LHIREAIERAQIGESEHKHLESYIRSAIDKLHHSIDLPGTDKAAALRAFLTGYINQVPDIIDALIDIAEASGAFQEIEKLINIAVAYFNCPPEDVRQNQGMLGLIDEAYLSLRLVEETNDRIQARHGFPLLPIDLSIANLVVHSLLGDKFANQLDLAVHYATSELFESKAFDHDDQVGKYLERLQANDWEDLLERWPRIVRFEEQAVSLSLGEHTEQYAIH